MRSSSTPASLASKGRTSTHPDNTRQPTRYVEGESEDEDQMNAEPPVESGDEEGSVEDVELGGESEDGEGEDEGDGEDDSEDAGESGDGNASDGSEPPLNEYADDDEDDDDESE